MDERVDRSEVRAGRLPSEVPSATSGAALASGSMHLSRYLAAVAALSLIALGSIVTLGWIIRVEALIQVLPSMLPMTRNTAACFLLSGVALLLPAINGPRWLVVASAGLVGVVGSLTLLHHLFGIVTGIADILGPPYVPATSTGAGMALITAIAFTIGAIGLAAAPWRASQRAGMVVGITGSIVVACGVAGLTAAGILSGARGLAPHSVVGFWILGAGLLALGWQTGSDRSATPRWLPIAIVIGILSGLLGLWRTLIVGGHDPLGVVSIVVLTAGIVLALSFGLTVYLAQRGFAQSGALRRNEAELRQILDNMPTLVSLLAPNGNVQLISRRTMEYTGKTRRELEAWGMTDLIHADDRDGTIEGLKKGLASNEPHSLVFRMRRHDGVYRWFEALQTPLKDESGRVLRWCVAVNDIDDRKRLEDSLRESARNWRSVIDGIPGLAARLAPDGGVAFVNHQILEFTGAPLEELRNWGTNGIVHPDDMPHVAEIFMASIAAGIPYLIEQRLRRHDGVYRWFDNRGLPIRDESGTVTGWYVLMADIHDRKRVEDALRQSEREARLIVDSIPGGIEVLSRTGELEAVNDHIVRYFGRSPAELKRRGLTDFMHPEDVQTALDQAVDSTATGKPYDAELRFRGADGTYRWFQVRGLPVRDDRGSIIRWYALHTDIDDRKRAEEALREGARDAQLVVDSIDGMIALFSPEGQLNGSNQQLLNYFRQPLEQVMQWATNGMTHPDDLQHCIDSFMSSIASGEPYDFETRFRRYDGVYRWFQIRGRPLLNADGRIVRWYGLLSDVDDRKRAEEALAGSERKLQLTIDTMPAMAWSTTPDGMADFFNQHYLDYVGLPPEQLQGTAWGATVHPIDVPGLISAWQGMVESGQGGYAEARIRQHDGQYHWFLQRANPLRDESGKIVRWYGINTDIEDRKRAEASNAREKQLLEMIASGSVPLREVLTELCRLVEEDSVDILCDVHPIDWSTRTFRFGTSPTLPEEYTAPIAGLPVEDELLPCAVAANENVQIIAEDLETDPRWQTSHVRLHALKHGLRSVWSTPILSTSGTVLGTLCIYQRKPATPTEGHQSLIAHATHIASIAIERLQTEEELRRSYDRLAAAQKLSKTGNFTADVVVDNHIWSAELYRIFELDPKTKISVQDVRGVIHPDDLPAFDADFGRSAAEGTPFDQVFRINTVGGNLKYVHALAEVAELSHGRPVFSGAIRDVTDEKVAELALNTTRSELAHVARVTALSTLSASIAHEVSQPLSGIITNASTSLRMLAADPPNIEGALETARRTIRDGNRASEVITRLRALFSRKAAASEDLDLNEAARAVVALTSSELQKNRIEIEIDLADGLPTVTGDRVQLQQVILNLLLNASDALRGIEDRSRRIVIKTEVDEDTNVRLTVEDTGAGIDPDTINRLFDAFYTTKDTGMGIGLSVSRSIIEHHHGRIWASTNTGPGARFSLALPVAATQVAQPSTAGEARTGGDR